MGFWWVMFGCNLLVPAILLIGGYGMWKHCPKEINSFVGYRTKRSVQNEETWKFAHDYCGRLWWKLGWILAALTVPAQCLMLQSSADEIGTVSMIMISLQTAVLLMSILPTERALKKKFNGA